MCAEYNLKTTERDLSQLLRSPLLNKTSLHDWEQHTRLYGKAPVLLHRDGEIVLEEMSFSLLPRGGRVPFTANTRLDDWDERTERVTYAFDRPTWRDSFLRRRCVIPLTNFMEPIYDGPHAGQMMAFFDPASPILLVAGIYKETIDTRTGEVFLGFSVLTDVAHPFVREVGHHRTVITLAPADALTWIQEKPIEGPWGHQFLVEHKQDLDLETIPIRVMKNWKARVANSRQKREAEDRIRPLLLRSREQS